MALRIVIDTNVLVSALLFKDSLPFQVVKLAESKAIILYSQPIQTIDIITPDIFINQYL